MLRLKIQKIIEKATSTEDASYLICYLLEDEIGLDGNGWFDDDSEMQTQLESSYSDMSARVSKMLA